MSENFAILVNRLPLKIGLRTPRWRLKPREQHAAGIYRLLTMQGTLIVFLISALGFTYRGEGINEALVLCAIVLVVAMVLRWLMFVRFAAPLEAIVLLMAGSMAAGCLTVLLSTIGLPYRDAMLAGIDHTLFPFLNWPDLAQKLTTEPRLTAWMCAIYSSLVWQPLLLVWVLAAANQLDRLWHFVHAWILALLAAIAVFAIMPATAAYVHYGFRAEDLTHLAVNTGWRPAAIVEGIRNGAIRELGLANMSGLITFPSFHTIGAILLAWGGRRVPVIGFLFVIVNAAMLMTVPLIGGHYFVDMLAGVGVALLVIAGTRPRRVRQPAQYARAVANSTASTIASFAWPLAKPPSASIARWP